MVDSDRLSARRKIGDPVADDPDRVAALDRELVDLARRHDVGDGVLDWEYLLLTARTRGRPVAIRYSQVRIEARPSNPPRPCQALSSVSWTASSASWKDPSIR